MINQIDPKDPQDTLTDFDDFVSGQVSGQIDRNERSQNYENSYEPYSYDNDEGEGS